MSVQRRVGFLLARKLIFVYFLLLFRFNFHVGPVRFCLMNGPALVVLRNRDIRRRFRNQPLNLITKLTLSLSLSLLYSLICFCFFPLCKVYWYLFGKPPSYHLFNITSPTQTNNTHQPSYLFSFYGENKGAHHFSSNSHLTLLF